MTSPQFPGQYQPQYQPPRQRRRSHGLRNAFLAVASIIILIIVIAGVGAAISGGKTSGSASSPAASQPPASGTATAPATASRATVLATFTGSGDETTRKFTIGGDGTWKLDWSYSCAAFGQSGNFIVSGDGGNDVNGVNVNELGNDGKGGTWAYSDAGSHYLSVNSECSWHVRVIGVK